MILEATAELLRAVGDPSEVSVRAVASRVGRTTPQIYEHFAGRTDLLHEAAKHALVGMAARVDAAVGQSPDFRKRLRARAHAYVDFAASNPNAYRVLFMSPAETELSPTELLDLAGMGAVVRDLKDAKKAGRLAWPNVEQVALTMWVSLHGIASLKVTHPNLVRSPKLLDQLLDEFTVGLLPR
jgi:AcrR family transcriptional regulator